MTKRIYFEVITRKRQIWVADVPDDATADQAREYFHTTNGDSVTAPFAEDLNSEFNVLEDEPDVEWQEEIVPLTDDKDVHHDWNHRER